MAYQATFQRYEIKYLLTAREKEAVLELMSAHMQPDAYGRTTIRNIYYDTQNYRLIRRSLEQPAYKEKLRIRSYRAAQSEDPVFVELKKKYQSVVYKRRLIVGAAEAMRCFQEGRPLPVQSQIGNEIEYFRAYYATLRPTAFLSYDRVAYFAPEEADLRITFDENIRYRTRDFSLDSKIWGVPLLEAGQTLMEIKTPGGLPLWLAHGLSQWGVFKTSFSKYGSAYRHMRVHALSA